MTWTLFLDIDGVLNNASMLSKFRRYKDNVRSMVTMLDPLAVGRLNQICNIFNSPTVVLSSSWRIIDNLSDIQEALERRGFLHKISDKTGNPLIRSECNGECPRGHEILIRKNKIYNFVIIDDAIAEPGSLGSRWIRTSWTSGLLDSHIELAKIIREYRASKGVPVNEGL